MTTRIIDTTAHRWRIRHPRLWSSARLAWEENQGGNPLPGVVGNGSVFAPYLGADTIWQRDVRGDAMPLAENSAQLASWMHTESPTRYRTATGGGSGAFGGRTSFNTSVFGTQPIADIVVDSTDPACHFQFMDSCALPGGTAAERDAMILGRIPWPVGMTPALNGDRGLAIYDAGTGIIREWFGVNPVAGKPGHWTAATGGYSLAKPHFEDLAETNYPTQLQAGSSAVCLMHNSLGFIGADEVRRGRIDHAIAFTMANAIANVEASWPAVWSDGKYPPAEWSGWDENGGTGNGPYPGPSPRHGQWGRLPASVDPMFDPLTGLPYNPLTRLIIEAAKRYGLVGTDTNAWCHAFNAESGNAAKALTGVDPWSDAGDLKVLLKPADPLNAFAVGDFPWYLTEWAPVDWGRPNPDFRLRPSEVFPYEPRGGVT